jgi:hypothetical protein
MSRKAKDDDVLSKMAEYEHVPAMKVAQRIAHFLNWAAIHIRRQYFNSQLITKAIYGHAHMPKVGSKEVEAVHSAVYRAKVILRDKYKRGSDSAKGVGVRACVDDNDTVTHDVASKAKRLTSSKANLDKITDIVDPTKLAAKESAYFDNVTQASKRITSAQVQALQLPPSRAAQKPNGQTAAPPAPRRATP